MANRLSLFILLCLAASSLYAQSQANTGSIEGIVSDPAGRAVPGAGVTLQNTGTNFKGELITGENGRFRGLLLPLGSYKISAKAPNFATLGAEGRTAACVHRAPGRRAGSQGGGRRGSRRVRTKVQPLHQYADEIGDERYSRHRERIAEVDRAHHPPIRRHAHQRLFAGAVQ